MVLRKWLGLFNTFFFPVFGQIIVEDYVKLGIDQDFDMTLMFWVREGHRKHNEKDEWFALIPQANNNERFLDPEVIRIPPRSPGHIRILPSFRDSYSWIKKTLKSEVNPLSLDDVLMRLEENWFEQLGSLKIFPKRRKSFNFWGSEGLPIRKKK